MMLLRVVPCVLTLALTLAQDTCRYEFTVPKPQEGCLHSSKSIEDRLLLLERAVANIAKNETFGVSRTTSHDITSLAKTVASVRDEQKNFKDNMDNLRSSVVTEDKMKDVVQELTSIMDNTTEKTDARLELMTSSVQRFFHSLTNMESSVNDRLRQNHDRLALYLQELLDVKKEVADAIVNTNSSRMGTLVQDLEDLKKTLYTSIGVNTARYGERLKKDNDFADLLKNHTDEINRLMLHSQAMVDHTHVMTDNIKSISNDLEVLNNYARLNIAELVEKTYMMANDEPMTEDELMTNDTGNSWMKNEASVNNITAKIEASFQRLGEQLNHIMSTEADEDMKKQAGQMVDVAEGVQAGGYTKDSSTGPSVVQLEKVHEEGQKKDEDGQRTRLQELRQEMMSVQQLYQQLVFTYRRARC